MIDERPIDERPIDERPIDERPIDERPTDPPPPFNGVSGSLAAFDQFFAAALTGILANTYITRCGISLGNSDPCNDVRVGRLVRAAATIAGLAFQHRNGIVDCDIDGDFKPPRRPTAERS